MKKEISIEERKHIQLEMLQEIHDFCISNNIRYSLSYGTLIGAIRHNGFIPWDDDVDIMMPLPDMLRFKSLFKSDRLKFCDVDTEPHYEFAFPRIAFNKTYNQEGLRCKSYGVNIDLYPVVSIPEGKEFDSFYKEGHILFKKRIWMMKWRKRIIKRIPISNIPFHDRSVKRYRDFLISNSKEYGTTNTYYVIGGEFSSQEIKGCSYNFDLFEDIMLHQFEEKKFNITSRYHDFLTHYYGNYMELPPEEEREPYHGGIYFWQK